jgi:hypothetical protein
MRCVTYAGETVMTTDDVAAALVELTAAVAAAGQADAVQIPIVNEETGNQGEAELVIGVGNDVLSVPTDWDGDEPDFSAAAAELRNHAHYPNRSVSAAFETADDVAEYAWDPDLESFIDRGRSRGDGSGPRPMG